MSATISVLRCASAECLSPSNAAYTVGRLVFSTIFFMFFFCSGFVLRLAVEVFVFKCTTLLHNC